MKNYHTCSSVLFLIFNRPDTTALVFQQIRLAQPQRLYIAADGPRPNKAGDAELCAQARSIIEKIDWECEVKTLFRDVNLGCKYNVSSAVSWFFEQEEEGIILEDDCLPSKDFFRFCDELLIKYRNDTRVSQITGCNVQFGKKWGDASYYFSNNVEVWGWASWRRVWKDYDVEMSRDLNIDVQELIIRLYGSEVLASKFNEIFSELKANKIDTWDYQLKFLNFFENGLCVIPNVNLISNIGFRSDGTHTVTENHPYANIPFEDLPEVLIEPTSFVPHKEADLQTLNRDFGIKMSKVGFLKKILRQFK